MLGSVSNEKKFKLCAIAIFWMKLEEFLKKIVIQTTFVPSNICCKGVKIQFLNCISVNSLHSTICNIRIGILCWKVDIYLFCNTQQNYYKVTLEFIWSIESIEEHSATTSLCENFEVFVTITNDTSNKYCSIIVSYYCFKFAVTNKCFFFTFHENNIANWKTIASAEILAFQFTSERKIILYSKVFLILYACSYTALVNISESQV